MVNTPLESEMSMSSWCTPASSHRMIKSSPLANMSVVGIQAVAWVLRWSSASGPPPSAYSRIRVISLIWSMSPRNGLRVLPTFPPSSLYAVRLTSTASAGLFPRSSQILGDKRPHPAHRGPGNENRLAFYFPRFVRIGDPQAVHLHEGHQLPVLGARSAKY